ncbi:mercuric reductase [Bordetella sp. FB-8]|uniref:mercuric reductase n=1 Tax=Bordetella sp. FB-8 TaxID=1159870 RepID=UPI00039A8C5D|nr:mercuric reductase [Bordetella sp. FB-8]
MMINAQPPGWRNPRPPARYRFLVIGGGPAGLMAARTAAAMGARVALIEAHLIGGISANNGCIPSKTLIRTAQAYAMMREAPRYGALRPCEISVDFPAAMVRMRRIRERLVRIDSPAKLAAAGIDLYFGHAHFVGPDSVDVDGIKLRFGKALIATGSRAMLPEIEGLEKAGFLNNETIFDLQELPASLLVVGGGPLGCELAQAFARFGTRTLISHREPLFLPAEERDAAQMVSDALARDGVEIHLNSQPTRVREQDGRKHVDLLNEGNTATTVVDHILTGIGRLPAVEGLCLAAAGIQYDEVTGIHVDDFLRTSNSHVYAAGDVCLKFRFTNTAEASARIVVHNALLFGRQRLSALTVPWCTHTDPQVAHVGLYVKEARERNIPVKTFTVPMHDVDRAITDGAEDGFVKIHVREGTDQILGATIVGRGAAEMINVVSLAMVAGVGLCRLASVIHAYPTQGEAVRQAAQACADTLMSPLLVGIRRWWLKARDAPQRAARSGQTS